MVLAPFKFKPGPIVVSTSTTMCLEFYFCYIIGLGLRVNKKYKLLQVWLGLRCLFQDGTDCICML